MAVIAYIHAAGAKKGVSMKYGFVLSFGPAQDMIRLAIEAEDAGWDGVFTWDAISIGTTPVYDPWVMMGAIAGVTERVTIGAMILPLARRRPWKVVKEAVTIDHLSDGRLVLPVALGVPDDAGFNAVNTDSTDRKQRAERLDEALDILALGQTGEPFTYAGKHYQVNEMQLLPKPVQERIPVWSVAGWPHEKSLARAAKWDGIIPVDMSPGRNPFDPVTLDVLGQIVNWCHEHRDTTNPFDVVLEGKTEDAQDNDTVGRLHEAGATWFIESRWDETETPESLVARIRKGPPRI